MAIASITNWLNSKEKNYHNGRLLYEQYGESKTLLTLFNTGSTNFHFKKLLAALEDLNKLANLEPKQITIPNVIAPIKEIGGKYGVDFESAPEAIQEIIKNKNDHYARARKLHESIRIMDNQEHRLEAGLQLLKHMEYVYDAWSAINEWKDNGRIRELEKEQTEIAVSELTTAQLYKELANLAPNISKDKTKLKTIKEPKKQAEVANRLQDREHRLKLIKERISNESL
jgi:hypothetical protein